MSGIEISIHYNPPLWEIILQFVFFPGLMWSLVTSKSKTETVFVSVLATIMVLVMTCSVLYLLKTGDKENAQQSTPSAYVSAVHQNNK